ncbi:hypothetical protein SD71_18760 [Cohnella kolymensis]|uniref:Uncharacterized protein n=1 Tax=Cohnella kolymensis TaxID=1590652 RepID=A0ABR5A0G0_9BACL|nr:hypothetical protein [Cohnella kolymensis]KIL34530.1 hypothetical protein SD71_18760 [Cohnella kolymensis]
MSSNDELRVPQEDLVDAWGEILPRCLNNGDSAEVRADEADPSTLRVHIDCAGRQMYEFDFAVRYVDSREIDVQLTDAEKDGQTVDETNEIMQGLIEDYRRHLHECAQQLHSFTHI